MHIIEFKNEIKKDYKIEAETTKELFLYKDKEIFVINKKDIMENENVISVDINIIKDVESICYRYRDEIISQETFHDISKCSFLMLDSIKDFIICYSDGTASIIEKNQKNCDFIEKLFIEKL